MYLQQQHKDTRHLFLSPIPILEIQIYHFKHVVKQNKKKKRFFGSKIYSTVS